MKQKQCTGCKIGKSLSEFYNSKNTKDGKTYRCKTCINEQSASYTKANPDKVRAKGLAWKNKNREKVNREARERYRKNPERFRAKRLKYYHENKEAELKRRRNYRKNNKAKESKHRREYNMKNMYGITPEQYEGLLKKQGNKCAICRADKPRGQGAWHIDHDHKTSKVRGILCHSCNTGIGQLKDDPKLLREAIKYLNSVSRLN